METDVASRLAATEADIAALQSRNRAGMKGLTPTPTLTLTLPRNTCKREWRVVCDQVVAGKLATGDAAPSDVDWKVRVRVGVGGRGRGSVRFWIRDKVGVGVRP